MEENKDITEKDTPDITTPKPTEISAQNVNDTSDESCASIAPAEENTAVPKDTPISAEPTEVTEAQRRRVSPFLRDMLAGYLMGIAFIIPGFSGGSIAAIVGIFERLICAVTDIFKSFKKSMATLLPVGIGLVLGAASLLFPLKLALSYAPLPTVSLFIGLALGGMFSITERLRGKFTVGHCAALVVPLLVAASLSFLPTGAEVDLFSLDFGGFTLLFFVAVLASTALVVPGISGSMLLLILGYYNPIVCLMTDHLLLGRDVWHSILVLGVTAIGIIVGFLIISVIMKTLLKRYPRGTYFSIVGFIIGSIPSAFISTAKEAGFTLSTLPTSFMHWISCVVLLAAGFIAALLFVIKVKKALNK